MGKPRSVITWAVAREHARVGLFAGGVAFFGGGVDLLGGLGAHTTVHRAGMVLLVIVGFYLLYSEGRKYLGARRHIAAGDPEPTDRDDYRRRRSQ